MKALIWGQIINYSSRKKKLYQKQTITRKIINMKREQSKTKDAQLFQQVQAQKL